MFQLSSPLDLNQSIVLAADQLHFQGSKTLTQFNVISQSFYSTDNNSSVRVKIVLQRIFSYHLSSTYIPTASLLMLVEVTLFFKKTQTELGITLTLTVMLVMYTMYQSITEPLTKTAYLKMIDYWLIFCLLIPFAIFMIEIFWLLNTKTNLIKSGNNKSWLIDYLSRKIQNRQMIQYLVPVVTCLFIAFYVFTATIIFFFV
jgi:hypothetical protein